jgi:hypothetical protein
MLVCYNYIPLLADVGIDDSREEYSKWGVTRLHDLVFDTVADNSIIFVKIDKLNDHGTRLFINSKIQDKRNITLLSGVGANPPSQEAISFVRSLLDKGILSHWYSTNMPSFGTNDTHHLPIGFEEIDRMPNKTQDILWQLKDEANKIDKIPGIYIPYHSDTNGLRYELKRKIQDKIGIVVNIEESKLSFIEYMRQLSKYTHVACFPGAGDDTHRVYETIWMGGIPIHWNTRMFTKWCDEYKILHTNGYKFIEDSCIDFNQRQNTDITPFLVKTYYDKTRTK